MGPRCPSSERGKWPLCLSPIRGAAGFAPQPRESTRCWGHKGRWWWDGRVSDTRTARSKQQLQQYVVYIINQSINHMWSRRCGSARMAWSRPLGPEPETWGRVPGPQSRSPLAHLPAARGFPGTRPRTTTTTPRRAADHPDPLRPNGSYCGLPGSQHQPRVGLMVRVPLLGAPRPSRPRSRALLRPVPERVLATARRGSSRLVMARHGSSWLFSLQSWSPAPPAGWHRVSCRQHPRACAASRPSRLAACGLATEPAAQLPF